MSKNLRIRTTPNGDDKYVKFKLEQDFDFLEVLSLKISQSDVYRRFYSDYGVLVGRVVMNNGVGVPNANVSIFMPLDENDNDEIKYKYPYTNVSDKNNDGIRYNLLPSKSKGGCHTPVGTFPEKREVLDDELTGEIFNKYYKYTATTNDSGDFMIFGVPVGNHIVNVDVDISDIGIFSQKPYDLIDQGTSEKMFNSTTKFKGGKNLNSLPQIKNMQSSVNIKPFWGESESTGDEIGISRLDFDLNYEMTPKAIFMGNNFSDNEKNSVNKNCQTRKKAGKVCETVPSSGRIRGIRKTMHDEIEEFYMDGDNTLDGDGNWVYSIPMNTDYMVTDEFGKLIPTDDPNKGIPTRSTVRFKLESEISGGEGRLRTKANYLIPHNPKNKNEIDYEFGEKTKETSFRDIYWNKIYSIKNFIPRFQGNDNGENRNFIGFKDTDDCVGTKNPIPFNRMDSDFNPLYILLCIIITFIIDVMMVINGMMKAKILGSRICDIGFIRISCARIKCMGIYYAPNCMGTCYDNSDKGARDGEPFTDDVSDAKDCFQITLAEALNVYEFDFYNDWINGSLYSLLVKYKKKRSNDKFCDVDDAPKSQYLVDSLTNDVFEGFRASKISEGIIKKYEDELFYAPTTKDGMYKLLATDIVCLGVINEYDWQGQPKIQEYLTPTSYKIPPLVGDIGEVYDYTSVVDYGDEDGLLFDLNCLRISVNSKQARNIKRLCELGVGIDEDRSDEPNGKGKDGKIGDGDIDYQYPRDGFIMLNNRNAKELPENGLTSGFNGGDYDSFRGFNGNHISQPENSFYFYFGTQVNKTALDKMNKKYFSEC